MTLLENMPHTGTGRRRKWIKDDLGHREEFEVLFTDMSCWVQQLGHASIQEFALRGIVASAMAYFTENPGLNEKDVFEHSGEIYQVQSTAFPDSSVGLGIVYAVGLRITTTGST